MVCDENKAPNGTVSATTWSDPMAMLFEAKKENTEIADEKVAMKVAMQLQELAKREEEEMKIALMLQSQEDDALLRAAAQEEEDLRLAKQTQMEEEKQAAQEKKHIENQLTEDEKIAMAMQQELIKQLYEAVTKGDTTLVHKMISQGIDTSIIMSNATDKQSALQMAVRSKNLSMVQIFAEAKDVKVNYQDALGCTAMHRAAETNRCDIIEVLIKAGAKVDVKTAIRQTPLMHAARAGHLDPIVLLIKHGADLYVKDKSNKMALQLVPLLSRSLKSKLEGMMGWNLLEAARKGRGDEVMALIDRGASTLLSDDKNMTALHFAAMGGHNIVVEYLLQQKANPNARDLKGETPLHKAAQYGSGCVWTTLLRHGADPEIKDLKGLVASEHCNTNLPLTSMILSNRKRSPTKSPPKEH